MNRLAFFVEGYTEVVFLMKLVEEIAGENNVLIEWRKIRGGSAARRSSALVQAAKPASGQKYYVLIVDCGGDRLVKPRIIEEHENLTRKGYQKVVGLRDVRPDYTHATIGDLGAMLPKYIKTSLVPVEFVLAILEIEAWFLAEVSHFQKIDPAITLAAIRTNLGFDPENEDMEQRPEPAVDMNNCYAIAGKSYEKQQAKATVEALDYPVMYVQLVNKFASLRRLTAIIEVFLAA